MPTREDAEKLRRETERIRTSRLEGERSLAEEQRVTEQQEREGQVSTQNYINRNDVHRTTRRLEDLKGQLLWLREYLENWDERNTKFRDAGAREIIGHLAAIAGLVGCIVVDTIVLTLPSRIVSRGFRESIQPTIGDADWIVPVIAFVFSTSYFAAEFFIGYQLGKNPKPATNPVSDRAFAVIACVTLPILTFVYTLINTGVFSNDPLRVIGPATVAGGIMTSLVLGTAALIVHAFVLYYSDAIALGFAFIYYKFRTLIIRFRINRTVRQISQVAGDAEIGVLRFVEDFRRSNNGNGHDPGMFSETATHGVNDLFGRVVIEEPAERGSRKGERNGRPGQAAKGEPTEHNAEEVDQDTPADNVDAGLNDENPVEPEDPGPGFNWEDEDEVRG